MTKAKISEYDAVAANNTDVNGVNIAENCPPSGMNNMGREIMAALKRFQTGADGDSVTVGGSLVVSGTATTNTLTAGPVSATTLNTSGAVVFNDAGADVDFRVESDTAENALFVEGSSGNVGIGDTPVGGKVNANSTRVTIAGTNAASYGAEFIAAGTNASIAIGSGGAASYVWTAENYPMIFATNGTERMRILSSGGITFNGDTAAANALDDYEEGTFTPTISSGITSPTYANQYGFYTKVGRFVSFQLRVQTNGGTAAASIIIVSGLPFTTAGTAGLYGGAYFNYASSEVVNSLSNNLPTMHIPSGGVRIEFYLTDGTNFDGTDANNAAGLNMYISGSYFAA